MNGRQRVDKMLRGEVIDRPPLYEIFRSDAVINHFAGENLTFDNAKDVTRRAVAAAVDATRGLPKLPVPDGESKLPDGRRIVHNRWTRWVEPRRFASNEDYAAEKKKFLEQPTLSERDKDLIDEVVAEYDACDKEYFSEVAFFWNLGLHPREQFGVESPSLIGPLIEDLYSEIGLDQFALLLYFEEALIDDLLEWRTLRALETLEYMPADIKPFGFLFGDDLAFKTAPVFNPDWFDKHYWGRLKRIVDAVHARGSWFLFHSDGNLNMMMDSMVATGIDILNPIERLAGMDIKQIHDKYPDLAMAGGIDVSQLLAVGTPDQVRDEVHRAIDEAGGKLLVGSSTEIHDAVPLENYLALREATGVSGMLDHIASNAE